MQTYPQLTVRRPGPTLAVWVLSVVAAAAWLVHGSSLLDAATPRELLLGFFALAGVVAGVAARTPQGAVATALVTAVAEVLALAIARLVDLAAGGEIWVVAIVALLGARFAMYYAVVARAQLERELSQTSHERIHNRKLVVSDGARAARTPTGRAALAIVLACAGVWLFGGLASPLRDIALACGLGTLGAWAAAASIVPAIHAAWIPAMPGTRGPQKPLGPLARLVIDRAPLVLIAGLVALAAAALGLVKMHGSDVAALGRVVVAGMVALLGLTIWLVSPRLAARALVGPVLAGFACAGALGWLGHADSPAAALLVFGVFCATLGDATFWFRFWYTDGKLNHLAPEAASAVALHYVRHAVAAITALGLLAIGLVAAVVGKHGLGDVLVAVAIGGVTALAVVPALVRLTVVKLPPRARQQDIELTLRRIKRKQINMDPARRKLRQYSAEELSTLNSWDFFTLLGINTLRHAGTAGTRRLCYELNLKPGAKVLQVGLGTANYCKWMIEEYDVDIYGIDIEPYMVERAREQAQLDGIADRMHLLAGDATLMPYRDNTFDAVISESFLYAVNQARALPEIYRVLKPGGGFGGSEWTWTHPPPRDIRGMNCTIACGFERPGMSHFYTREGWIDVFKSHSLDVTFLKSEPFIWFSWPGMTDNEGGALSVMKIFARCLSYAGARARFMEIVNYLARYEGWMTTSVFVARKPMGRVFRVLDQPPPIEDAQIAAEEEARLRKAEARKEAR